MADSQHTPNPSADNVALLRLQDDLSSVRNSLHTGIDMLHDYLGRLSSGPDSEIISRIDFVVEALEAQLPGIQEVLNGIEAVRAGGADHG